MKKVLWLAPSFNHYKASFLDLLTKTDALEITILSGTGRTGMGDGEIEKNWNFKHIKVPVPKIQFGKSNMVKRLLKENFSQFDWVLIPAEKKNLLIFIYALKLKSKYPNVKLFSYNHPILKSRNGKTTFLDKLITKFYYKKLNRVIFYTQESCRWAIQQQLINPKKAFWVNNTIDTNEVLKHYKFTLPPNSPKTILFIGRLIPSKRVDLLFEYYKELKTKLPNINLQLEIIGDGPDNNIVKEAIKNDGSIIWHGTLVNEEEIAPIMKRTSFVFIPGLSGLSINHAFAYGKPYLTLKADKHGPEISYINHGRNGYILNGDLEENLTIIYDLITNNEKLQLLSNEAKLKGEFLSVENWVSQMKYNLTHE